MLFEPEPNDPTGQRARAKRRERAIGILYILGAVLATIVLIYVIGFLD
jgi:hypothetical protein